MLISDTEFKSLFIVASIYHFEIVFKKKDMMQIIIKLIVCKAKQQMELHCEAQIYEAQSWTEKLDEIFDIFFSNIKNIAAARSNNEPKEEDYRLDD